jgi:hypothetical protein
MSLPYLDRLRGVTVYVDGVQVPGTGRIKGLNFTSTVVAYDPVTGIATIGAERDHTIKDPVRVATTGALVATRTGNVLTANANGALAAQDGVSLSVGNRVLVWQQTLGADNGIYTVTSLGSAGTPYVFTRAADMDSSAEVFDCLLVPAREGTQYANQRFQLTANDTITLNSTALTFIIERGGVILDIFTVSGTWTKRPGLLEAVADCIAAGGSGGGGAGKVAGGIRQGGTGGGGGARSTRRLDANDLSSTETVTVAVATTGGAGGSVADGSDGKAGSFTAFGVSGSTAKCCAYGGGAGGLGSSVTDRSGAGGGGSMSVGVNGGTTGAKGGEPGGSQPTDSNHGANAGFGGGAGGNSQHGRCSMFGGGGGGGCAATAFNGRGGNSCYAAGGGGAGGFIDAANSPINGQPGGGSGCRTDSVVDGSGGAAGTGSAGAAGTDGVAGNNDKSGTGGGGGAPHTAGTGGKGGAGGIPGGAGGGGGPGTTVGGAGGDGARGECRVWNVF